MDAGKLGFAGRVMLGIFSARGYRNNYRRLVKGENNGRF
jgi:hypothetical protein